MSSLDEIVQAVPGDDTTEVIDVAVHVQPMAGRTALVGRHGAALKLRVAAAPVEDRANEAAAALLGELLEIPARDVTVEGGQRSRTKRLRARGVDVVTARERLQRALDAASEPAGRPRGRRTR
jgi:uncharacterized protein (TIGR00251 family)